MKRFLAGILSIIYLTVASGMVVSIHYCMGKKTGVDYRYHAQTQCNKCGMENKQGCCHDEFKIVKLATDQQLAKASLGLMSCPALVAISHSVPLSQSIQGSEKFLSFDYHSPPDYGGTFLFVLRI